MSGPDPSSNKKFNVVNIAIAAAVLIVAAIAVRGCSSMPHTPPHQGAAPQNPNAPGSPSETQTSQSGCPAATDTEWQHCTYRGASPGILAGKAGMKWCFDQPSGKDQPSIRQRWDSQSSTHWVDWLDNEPGNPDVMRFRFVGNDPSELVTNGYRLRKPEETCPQPGT